MVQYRYIYIPFSLSSWRIERGTGSSLSNHFRELKSFIRKLFFNVFESCNGYKPIYGIWWAVIRKFIAPLLSFYCFGGMLDYTSNKSTNSSSSDPIEKRMGIDLFIITYTWYQLCECAANSNVNSNHGQLLHNDQTTNKHVKYSTFFDWNHTPTLNRQHDFKFSRGFPIKSQTSHQINRYYEASIMKQQEWKQQK